MKHHYTMQKKEMTAIIHYLQVWQHYLVHIIILMDNVATGYFQTHKKLSPKQVRWQDFLAKFNYRLEYKLEKANVIAKRSLPLSTHQGRSPTRPPSERLVGKNSRRQDKTILTRGRHPPHQRRLAIHVWVGKFVKISHQGVPRRSGLATPK